MEYVISDDSGIIAESADFIYVLNKWINSEIHNIKQNTYIDDENEYKLSMKVIKKLKKYTVDFNEDPRTQFLELLKIIEQWEDVENFYDVQLIIK
ncbi:hypothetical protein [Mammaliicoccus vitulinus]|uniref:hypothetical protein n=1 Tax=Mammaliicoccus vitulinus TaxID=71237 RepID=UPI00248CC1E7|nr:hypothetical protein [Mammaliicoccus vitulinus]